MNLLIYLSFQVVGVAIACAEHHAGQRSRLRELLSTGRTYTTGELLKVSSRFGARLLELRRGVDGPALDVRVARLNGKGSDFAYTCVGLPHLPG
jgi:hypothetical protein